MGKCDQRFDAYIKESPEFARPILTHIGETVHSACPDVEETFKWSHPHFVYHGKILTHLLKQAMKLNEVGITAPRTPAPPRAVALKTARANTATANTVTANTATASTATAYTATAYTATAKKSATNVLKPPADLASALALNRAARNTFDAFSPSARKEYIEWITEAKTEGPRSRRLEQAVQ